MWAAINYPTVLGLLAINRTELAWEEYERNSLHWQAGVTPEIWIGLWTSADSVNAGADASVNNPPPLLAPFPSPEETILYQNTLGTSMSRRSKKLLGVVWC